VIAVARTDARRAALAALIDHAALFPPASMSLEDALAADAAAGTGPAAFMLGRFVVPASRLGELGGLERRLSVVLDVPLPADSRIESVECALPAEPEGLVGVAPEVYVEIPLDDSAERRVAELAALGLRLKVRCGGASVPTIAALAAFVRACRRAGVVFKATAGLHHAVRAGGEHGVLNLLAAVVFGDEEDALAEEDAGAFRLDAHAFAWRGREAGPDELALARRERFHSIGSCSFREPVEELEELGILAP